jgi:[ribosomal protein S5]-alanine N-acetyltransferase
MTPELETKRLVLRPLELADADQMQILFPQWEIVRYLVKGVPWPYPPDGAVRHIRDVILPAGERGECCVLRAPKAIANTASRRVSGEFQRLEPRVRDRIDGFCHHALPLPNPEKQGMPVVAVEERDYVSGRFRTEVWEITAAEWRAWKARQTKPRPSNP